MKTVSLHGALVPVHRCNARSAWNDAASAKMRHHQYRHSVPHAQIGHPGAYGSPGNLTPGYSSTARTPPTNTNGN
jgi:hypothetical protein